MSPEWHFAILLSFFCIFSPEHSNRNSGFLCRILTMILLNSKTLITYFCGVFFSPHGETKSLILDENVFSSIPSCFKTYLNIVYECKYVLYIAKELLNDNKLFKIQLVIYFICCSIIMHGDIMDIFCFSSALHSMLGLPPENPARPLSKPERGRFQLQIDIS